MHGSESEQRAARKVLGLDETAANSSSAADPAEAELTEQMTATVAALREWRTEFDSAPAPRLAKPTGTQRKTSRHAPVIVGACALLMLVLGMPMLTSKSKVSEQSRAPKKAQAEIAKMTDLELEEELKKANAKLASQTEDLLDAEIAERRESIKRRRHLLAVESVRRLIINVTSNNIDTDAPNSVRPKYPIGDLVVTSPVPNPTKKPWGVKTIRRTQRELEGLAKLTSRRRNLGSQTTMLTTAGIATRFRSPNSTVMIGGLGIAGLASRRSDGGWYYRGATPRFDIINNYSINGFGDRLVGNGRRGFSGTQRTTRPLSSDFGLTLGDPRASEDYLRRLRESTGTPAPKTTLAPKDINRVREHFKARFKELANANPKQAVKIARVSERIAATLYVVEQQVAQDVKAGKKVTHREGQAIVSKLVQAELDGLDIDGDGRGDFSREAYDTIVENAFRIPLAEPLSTFSIDVDTASFSNVRRFIAHGQLPPRNAVRVEELLNYFSYDYKPPKKDDPFSVNLEVGRCPWNHNHRLLRIGLQGREIPHDKRPPSNLVFLIDVSGSMKSSKKLPLVKIALELLVNQMTAKDRISIVTYSNEALVVLEPTTGDKKDTINEAIQRLVAAGGTNGAAGIQMAYAQAKKHLLKKEGGANRVILCTDGDLNIGISSDAELVKLIEKKREESRIFLSVFGFGTGNLKGSKMEKLADKGNGHYAYIDGPTEAKKVFVEEMTGMLYTIAKDVKIQVEFNPTQVGSYRLIGYENRILAAADFNNDKKDAGEIGAGHTVTALYEIVPVDPKKKPAVDGLKYQQRVKAAKNKPQTQELLTVKLRYKKPNGDKSVKREFAITDVSDKKAMPSLDFEWASAVALYGMMLRDSKYAGQGSLDLVRELAAGSSQSDPHGHRKQFLKMVYHTRALVARKLGQPIPAPRPFEAGGLDEK